MNNAVFGEVMESVRKHRYIKLVTLERRRNYLMSEANYHTTKSSTENLLAIERKKTQTLMNKQVYLGLSLLELSRILMYEFWYDYIKWKYDTKSYYKDIAKDVETIFDTRSYGIDRPLTKKKF